MDRKLQYKKFKNWAEKHQFSLLDLFPTIGRTKAYHIDLSKKNTIVRTETEFNNPLFFEGKLAEIQEKNTDTIITGGYLEKRALYTSDIYNTKNSSEKRNIHLGLDFWLPENTPVHAILAGDVICAIHQKDYKGYGGFVILKHHFNGFEFFSLYGHLSEKSVTNLSRGQKIQKNELIGTLGNYEENGKWLPHLHFQIMLSLLDYTNDFPGVALERKIEYWKMICPNPNLLFGF